MFISYFLIIFPNSHSKYLKENSKTDGLKETTALLLAVPQPVKDVASAQQRGREQLRLGLDPWRGASPRRPVGAARRRKRMTLLLHQRRANTPRASQAPRLGLCAFTLPRRRLPVHAHSLGSPPRQASRPGSCGRGTDLSDLAPL